MTLDFFSFSFRKHFNTCTLYIILVYENNDIAITMSPSRADPVLGLNIYMADWRDLNIKINATALAGSIKMFKSVSLHWLGAFNSEMMKSQTDTAFYS